MTKAIKRSAYRLARMARRLARVLLRPHVEWRHWQQFRVFAQKNRPIFKTSASSNNGQRVMLISLMGDFVGAAKIEAFLAFGLVLRGCEIYALTSRGSWSNRYYRLLGVKHFIYYDDILSETSKASLTSDINQAMAQCQSFDALMAYSFRGVQIGKYVCSTLVRKTHSGTVNLADLQTRKQVQACLIKAMETTLAAEKIFDTYLPTTLLFLERGYSPFGEFFDMSLSRGLNTIQWCGSHRDDAFILKRYVKSNADQHPSSLSEKTWTELKAMPWSHEKAQTVEDELFKSYASGKWFSEVGTQFNTRIYKPEEIKQSLGLDPKKKTAVIFSHLFWDATFFWGTDLFDNYREWFVETVKAACKNDSVNWLLKLHPANVVKLTRDGYKQELVEKLALTQEIGQLPPHIKILEPNTPISTYSLFSVMDYCLTVRGTIGIESAFFGIPVITGGTGRYDAHGFTIDSATREEYLQRLSQIATYSHLTASEKELAQKFAYGTFLLRPFPLHGINVSYEKNSTATQKIDFIYASKADLENADDLKEFADWVLDSRDEDYLSSEPAMPRRELAISSSDTTVPGR